MKKTLSIFVLLGLAAGGYYWYAVRVAREESTPDYTTATVARGDVLQTVTATGTIDAVLSVDVGSQISGQITKLYADYNTPVKEGQKLAELDPSTYQQAVLWSAMTEVRRRQTPSVRAEGEVEKPARDSTKSYQRDATASRQTPATPKQKPRALYWANEDRYSVVTCKEGSAHVFVVERSGSWLVYVARHHRADSVERIGTFPSECKARKAAAETARGIGLDSLAHHGNWRGKRATADQRSTLRDRGIGHDRLINRGEAGDLIALGIAKSCDPEGRVQRSRQR